MREVFAHFVANECFAINISLTHFRLGSVRVFRTNHISDADELPRRLAFQKPAAIYAIPAHIHTYTKYDTLGERASCKWMTAALTMDEKREWKYLRGNMSFKLTL